MPSRSLSASLRSLLATIKPSRSFAGSVQALLAAGPIESRMAALGAVCEYRSQAALSALKLVEAWEPDSPVGAAAARERARREAEMDDPFAALADWTPVAAAFASSTSPYKLLDEVGLGTRSVVFLAVQSRVRRLVALKVLRPEVALQPGSRDRFQRDMQAMARIGHAGVPAIHDIGTHGGHEFAALQLVEGSSLTEVLASEGPLPWKRATRLLAELAEAVDAGHQVGVAHGGVSTGHAMVDRRGKARLVGWAPGTSADLRADLQGLGTVLLQMLSGSPTADDAVLTTAVDVPTWLADMLERLLSPDRRVRPPSAAAVIAECQVAEAAGADVGAIPGIPAAPAPVASGPPIAPISAPGLVEAAASPTPQRRHVVLVVDDSRVVLNTVDQMLSNAGYTVITAESPRVALQLAERHTLDVLLTDMAFPEGMDGAELVAEARHRFPNLPVLAMSGIVEKSIRDEMIAGGVATFLSKPLEPREVIDAVSRACIGAGRSLLLVDDDRLIRLVLKRLFETASFRVAAAPDIPEARRLVDENVPDMIVSDLWVRGESGLTLLKHVRDRGLDVPVIMLSGTPDAESVIAAYRLRVFDFVVKSDDTRQLIGAVEAALRRE